MNLKSALGFGAMLTGVLGVMYGTVQSEFYILFSLYSIAFLGYLMFIYNMDQVNWKTIFFFGLILRCCIVPVFPQLSDDIYRFYWDGLLWNDGINPLTSTPRQWLLSVDASSQYQTLFPKLNSPDYHTIYPPICQLIFFLAAKFSNIVWSSIFLKLVFVAFEVLSFIGLLKVLDVLNKPKSYALIYFLNPLIILELTGNLHFETIMIFGMIWSIYFLLKEKYLFSGVCYALAILSKLIPLMLGPLLLIYLYKKGGLKLCLAFFVPAGGVVALGFALMFYGVNPWHLFESINLYFQTFEFNASIYYVIRHIGVLITGYNQIGLIGPLLNIIALIIIMRLSFLHSASKDKLVIRMVCILLVYLLFSTTVHPWYLSLIIMLGCMTYENVKFIVAWSYLMFLSYSAYDTDPVLEHFWALGIEYGVVFGMLFMLARNKGIKKLLLQ